MYVVLSLSSLPFLRSEKIPVDSGHTEQVDSKEMRYLTILEREYAGNAACLALAAAKQGVRERDI